MVIIMKTMTTATLTKNGMIHLPAEIRKKFSLKPGDKISFIDTGDGIKVVPIKDIFDLVDERHKDAIDNMVRELTNEHKMDAEKGL